MDERAELHARIDSLAHHDTLTGLPNRRMWNEQIPAAMNAASRTGRPVCVALIDLDHFKAFNDQFGHQAGDDLLEAVATAWGPIVRASDLLVRWGGEEFALLLPSTDEQQASDLLDRRQRVMPRRQSFSAGFTVVRVNPHDTVDLGAVMALADLAMYQAKHDGRARAVCADTLAG